VQTAQKNIAKQALHSLEQLGVAELHLVMYPLFHSFFHNWESRAIVENEP
jgi:hypothetical protein